MDKIYVNQMMFYGYHGVLAEEKKLGQRFFVDIILDVDLRQAGKSDDLNKTVNYKELYDLSKRIVEGPSLDLIESIGEKIAQTVIEKYAIVSKVAVKVIKPDPPIQGHFQSVAVEINRSRNHG